MEVKIVIRKTLDWGNMTPEKLLEQCQLCCDKQKFLENVNLWNKWFDVSYFDFRQRIKDIFMKHIQKLGCEITLFPDGVVDDRDVIIIPADDDDFYHPELPDSLRIYFKEHEEVDIVKWKTWRSSSAEYSGFYAVKRFDGTPACSYAMRSSLAHKKRDLLLAHRSAHFYLGRSRHEHYINKVMGIYNVHKGCVTPLQREDVTRDMLPTSKKLKIPNELMWAEEGILEMKDLFSSIGRKRIQII